jgi:steroid 5-alpha reductase family enzyme
MGVKKYVTIPTVIILASLFSYFASHQSRNVQGYSLFSILVVLAHLIQTIAFIPAFIFNTELFYDLTGSLTYITLILTAIFTNSDTLTVRQIIASFLVLLWAVRLGSFLFMRILKVGEDSRFISIKKSTLGFFHAWFIQGLWVSVTISPLLIIVVSDSKD